MCSCVRAWYPAAKRRLRTRGVGIARYFFGVSETPRPKRYRWEIHGSRSTPRWSYPPWEQRFGVGFSNFQVKNTLLSSHGISSSYSGIGLLRLKTQSFWSCAWFRKSNSRQLGHWIFLIWWDELRKVRGIVGLVISPNLRECLPNAQGVPMMYVIGKIVICWKSAAHSFWPLRNFLEFFGLWNYLSSKGCVYSFQRTWPRWLSHLTVRKKKSKSRHDETGCGCCNFLRRWSYYVRVRATVLLALADVSWVTNENPGG